jgi:hypothetical protein
MVQSAINNNSNPFMGYVDGNPFVPGQTGAIAATQGRVYCMVDAKTSAIYRVVVQSVVHTITQASVFVKVYYQQAALRAAHRAGQIEALGRLMSDDGDDWMRRAGDRIAELRRET